MIPTEQPDSSAIRVMPSDPRHLAASRSEQIWAAQAEAQRAHRRLPSALQSETKHATQKRREADRRDRNTRIQIEARTYVGRLISG